MPDPSHKAGGGGSQRDVSRVAVAGVVAACLLLVVVVASLLVPDETPDPETAPTSASAALDGSVPGSLAGEYRSVRADGTLRGKAARELAAAAKRDREAGEVMRFDLAPRPWRKVWTPAQLAEREAAREARQERIRARRERKKMQGAPFEMVIGSFNVLGSQHTAPGGDRRRFPPASVRNGQAVGYIRGHGVDVLGTQELQDDQLRALQSMTGMEAYPGFAWGSKETDNSILWDPGMFEFLSGEQFTINFVGRPRPQPIVKLKHRLTGQQFYVVNTHPSPGQGRALTERRNAQATTVGVINRLKADGIPVLITGDMNDRAEFYCQVVGPAGMTTPQGGSYGGGCRPPTGHLAVDWVAGTGVTWSNYRMDTSPVARRVSDHFFISATARVD
ncbi:endonuclease/exonuclease/phosphatase family protein [Nocardioides campestrisoli]|uniref:endonuclease/exonuclease/phosphatase family protein n=1 Tax=Nocardioides campestrisoli TaxID=2736757 RepID=UPI0015E6C486|nr:endonuclease/exonuclease/phosphatase family protein [Nocardioides campestrisoli]